jgi:hypothetical protein
MWLVSMVFILANIAGFARVQSFTTVLNFNIDQPDPKSVWMQALYLMWRDFDRMYYETFKQNDADPGWFLFQLMDLTQEEWHDYMRQAKRDLTIE